MQWTTPDSMDLSVGSYVLVQAANATAPHANCYDIVRGRVGRKPRDRAVAYVQMSDLPLFASHCANGIAGGNAQVRLASPPGEFTHHATPSIRFTITAI